MNRKQSYKMGWEIKPQCPHCKKESGRTWFVDGYVQCWECHKMSKYEDWF